MSVSYYLILEIHQYKHYSYESQAAQSRTWNKISTLM